MPLIEVTSATGDPVTYAEAKTHLRLDADDEQSYVTSLITMATKYAEHVTNRAFMRQTWAKKYGAFPSEIRLNRSPVRSVSSITYTAATGNTATLATTAYQIDSSSEPGLVKPAVGESWPSTQGEAYNAVTVTFVAGYATTTTAQAAAVPEGIKSAIKLHVAHLFENREPYVVGQTVNKVPMAVDSLLWQYRLPEVPA